MLVELLVTDLGVIDRLALLPGSAMTALTGETGAGKTLIVEAIDLLVGGRADGSMVRAGADEAVVEGRFAVGSGRDAEEVILRRVVPREGRSRAYIDGGLASAANLAEVGRRLVDLHGQHDHQSLLSPSSQRRALDRYAGVDLEPLRALRAQLHEVDDRLAALGGDERERAREVDLLRFQSNELAAAALDDPLEDERLAAEQDRLGDALAHREAALAATEALSSDGGAGELVAVAIAALDERVPFHEATGRLQALAAELTDVAREVRATGESIEDDEERLAEVRTRRKLLHDLGRKYGDTVDEMLKYQAEVDARLDELSSRDELAAALDAERAGLISRIRAAEAQVAAVRRAAAPRLAEETQAHLRELAMPKARLEVWVGADDPGDEVVFALAANPGSPPLPLAKVASGGELARTMLALRLVLTEAPDTLIFDEVDAGVGGEAATAVGRALAALGARHQVLVVTHLAQVAAFAAVQIQVAKHQARKRTSTSATVLDGEDRVVEVARMLSGSPDSEAARTHAAELLGEAAGPPPKRTRRAKAGG